MLMYFWCLTTRFALWTCWAMMMTLLLAREDYDKLERFLMSAALSRTVSGTAHDAMV